MLTGNKGEWSEIYVFLKLLADGRLNAADANLNAIPNVYYPIIKILRQENTISREYRINGNIKIVDGNNNELLNLPIAEFVSRSQQLFNELRNAEGRSFAFADIETHDLDGRGLGITSVEAMDAGVPIVAWAVDDNFPQFSFRSYGPSGFIDDGNPKTIADKIDQIMSDEIYRSTILDSQRRLVDDIYSCKSVTNQYLKLLET